MYDDDNEKNTMIKMNKDNDKDKDYDDKTVKPRNTALAINKNPKLQIFVLKTIFTVALKIGNEVILGINLK